MKMDCDFRYFTTEDSGEITRVPAATRLETQRALVAQR